MADYKFCPRDYSVHVARAGGVFYVCQVKLVCTFVQFFCCLVTLLASGSTDYGKGEIEVSTIAFELSISSINSVSFWLMYLRAVIGNYQDLSP